MATTKTKNRWAEILSTVKAADDKKHSRRTDRSEWWTRDVDGGKVVAVYHRQRYVGEAPLEGVKRTRVNVGGEMVWVDDVDTVSTQEVRRATKAGEVKDVEGGRVYKGRWLHSRIPEPSDLNTYVLGGEYGG